MAAAIIATDGCQWMSKKALFEPCCEASATAAYAKQQH